MKDLIRTVPRVMTRLVNISMTCGPDLKKKNESNTRELIQFCFKLIILKANAQKLRDVAHCCTCYFYDTLYMTPIILVLGSTRQIPNSVNSSKFHSNVFVNVRVGLIASFCDIDHDFDRDSKLVILIVIFR